MKLKTKQDGEERERERERERETRNRAITKALREHVFQLLKPHKRITHLAESCY
jgi:hypothetical protein